MKELIKKLEADKYSKIVLKRMSHRDRITAMAQNDYIDSLIDWAKSS